MPLQGRTRFGQQHVREIVQCGLTLTTTTSLKMNVKSESGKLERQREGREKQRRFEGDKEKEVQDVYECLEKTEKKGETTSLDSFASKHFCLYSTDYFDHYYNPYAPSEYVEFYYLDENNPPSRLPPTTTGQRSTAD